VCGTSNAAQVQEPLQKLLPERVGPFILQLLPGGKREWQVEARLEHPLAAAMRKVDLAVPLLTRDPTTKAMDIFGDIVGARAGNRQGMTEDQGLHPIIRESCITLIILVRFLRLTLMANKLPEIAVFIHAISRAYLAAVKAHVANSLARQGRGAVDRAVRQPPCDGCTSPSSSVTRAAR
jgi:hypothetical protein